MNDAYKASARSAAMRRDFDSAFSAPAANPPESTTDLLAVRVGGDAYAIRLSDIAGLQVSLNVVSLPSPSRHLLGIAAIRGTMAPIYDLGGLLGYPPSPTARWIVMVKAPELVGFALETFEAQVRVADSLLHFEEATGRPQMPAPARGAVQAAGAVRPILQLSALIESIKETAHDR